MNKPMIENSERGVTLNKTLAWAMLLSLVSLVWFGGTTVSNLQNSTESLASLLVDTRQTASAVEARVRALETNASRAGAEFHALRQSLDEVKQVQRETNELLRQLARREGATP